jgi:hypothetical protein
VSSDIETELRDALAYASEPVIPRADLADAVRRASCRRRHALTATVATGLAVVLACSLIVVYLIGHTQRWPAPNHHGSRRQGMHFVVGYYEPDVMTAHGKWIYVAAGGGYPGEVLLAYDRATGRLVRSISIPGLPNVLKVGRGGLVWLVFYPDSSGGGNGVWLLSPDLTLRSGVNLNARRYRAVTPHDLLPTGEDTAIVATGRGLATLHLPLPGEPGSAVLRWLPPVRGIHRVRGATVGLAAFAGRVAVELDNDVGQGLISLAGSPSAEFLPPGMNSAGLPPGRYVRGADRLGVIAGSSGGLWTTLFTDKGRSLGLIRLDTELMPSTPSSIRDNPAFKRAQEVVTLGSVEWVMLSRPKVPLACFTDRGGQVGPVATLHLRPEPARNAGVSSIATVGDTLYVLGKVGVASYPIPVACR